MSIEVVSTNTDGQVQLNLQDNPEVDVVDESADEEIETKSEEKEAADVDEASDAQDSKDESSDDEDSAEENEDESVEAKPKKKSGIQKLKEKISRAEVEAQFWKEQALSGKPQKQETQNEQTQDQKTQNLEKPSPENYETQEDYIEALTDWKVHKAFVTNEAEKEQKKVLTEYQKQEQEFREKSKSFAESVDDFDEVLFQADKYSEMKPIIANLLLSSQDGPKVMYELAKNLEEYKAMNEMPPHLAAKAFGVFEQKILGQQPPKSNNKPKTSSAPKPISTVGSRSTKATRKSIYDPSLSQKEYEMLRQKQA